MPEESEPTPAPGGFARPVRRLAHQALAWSLLLGSLTSAGQPAAALIRRLQAACLDSCHVPARAAGPAFTPRATAVLGIRG